MPLTARGCLIRHWAVWSICGGFTMSRRRAAPPSPQEISLWLRTAPSMADFRLAGDRLIAAPASAQLDFGRRHQRGGVGSGAGSFAPARRQARFGQFGRQLNRFGEQWRRALASGSAAGAFLRRRLSLCTTAKRWPLPAIVSAFLSMRESAITIFWIPAPAIRRRPSGRRRSLATIRSPPGAISDVVATALVIGDDEETRRILNRFAVLFFRRNDGSEWIRPRRAG